MFLEQNRIGTGFRQGRCPLARNEDRRHLNEDSHEALTCYRQMKCNAQYSKNIVSFLNWGVGGLVWFGLVWLGGEAGILHTFCEIPSCGM